MTDTRMKDFFDLWVLLHDTTTDDVDLQSAIRANFTRLRTAMSGTQPIGLGDAFAEVVTR